ncbi:MAG: 2-hydroxy-3-oxopropionate reductase [Rhodospirillaceae bacterium]|nr:2-hydroxy-3-oxopropionate reductase [Rhodospirillaceae bacterium]
MDNNYSSLANKTVGLVGLGLMGEPMARQFQASGASLRIWNRNAKKSSALANELERVTACAVPRDVPNGADATVLMLTDATAVEEVVFNSTNDDNPTALVAGLEADAILIDMGTTSVLKTRQFSNRLTSVGAHWIDAPVSGGTTAAQTGSLTIMVGGSKPLFKKVLPWLKILGERITHVGDLGAGQIAKSANQMIVGLTIAAIAEAFTLARHNGVDPAKIREALMGGFAHSRILELHGERMITEDYAARAKCTIQRKDVAEALELAKSVNLYLPSLSTNLTLWDYMVDNDMGTLDHSALLLAIDPKS